MGVVFDSLKSLWTRGRLKTNEAVAGGIADAVTDLRAEGRSIIDEGWPGTATDTLRAWHDTLGVKYDASVTIEDQRTRLQAVATAVGGSSIGLLEAQIQKEFPEVFVVETTFSSEAGEDECGVAECGETEGVLDSTTYTLTGEIPDDSSSARIQAILARYAPAHMDPVSDLDVLSTSESSEAGEDQCGVAVSEGYEGFAPVAPAFSVAASIAGSGTIGTILWAYPGVVTGSPTPGLTYQWIKDTVDIPGATANWYLVAEGASYTCRVTATNEGGTADSTTSAIVTPNTVPFLTVGPDITPLGNTLTVSATFEGYPTPVKTYQWRKNTVDIVGQTSTTLDVTGRGVGSYDCVVTATNIAGSTPATSPATVVSVPVITWDLSFTQFPGFPLGYVRKTPDNYSATGWPEPVITYAWKKNTVLISTVESIQQLSGEAANYELIITATNDVGADSQSSGVFNPWS